MRHECQKEYLKTGERLWSSPLNLLVAFINQITQQYYFSAFVPGSKRSICSPHFRRDKASGPGDSRPASAPSPIALR